MNKQELLLEIARLGELAKSTGNIYDKKHYSGKKADKEALLAELEASSKKKSKKEDK